MLRRINEAKDIDAHRIILEAKDSEARTPFEWALYEGRSNMVYRFLGIVKGNTELQKSILSARDADSDTALHTAAYNDNAVATKHASYISQRRR